MDGEMIKAAARYVGTDTIIRHMAAREELLGSLKKEAAIPGFVSSIPSRLAGWGKGLVTYPRSAARKVVKSLPRIQQGFTEGGAEAGRRFFSPTYGIRKGWQELSGTSSFGRRIEDLEKMVASRAAKGKSTLKGEEAILKLRQKVPYMAEPSVPLSEAMGSGGVKGLAEELSRRGWTGAGPKMKYLPFSQKAFIAGMGAAEIPGIVNAPPATRTGEGGKLERLGGLLAGTGGWIAGSGRIGLIPGTALWLAAEKAGTKAGRVLDRMRAGASFGEAATAPSPREAREQLAKIYQTYGG